MALEAATLKQRSSTALVFVLVMLFGLLLNRVTFVLLFTVIHFGCWVEFIRLLKKINGTNWKRWAPLGLLYITLPVVLMIIIAYYHHVPSVTIIEGQYLLLPTLPGSWFSQIIPCVIIGAIWINDTMAYLVGSIFGKTPLSSISPKKTWEGTLGGIVLCIALVVWITHSLEMTIGLPNQHWAAIGAICAIAGTAGDLLESKLKRMANVKDSGSLMPGHGGFLDRFDSLLVAIPFVWLYLQLFVR